MRPEFDMSLYLVTDRPLSRGRDIEWIVEEAVKGGTTIVQLREKDCSTAEFVAIASRLMQRLKPLGIPLLINDRIDVALAVDADGVHIGQSDMPYDVARRLLGNDKIIGLSVETMDEVVEANALDVDYIGVSPVYSTATKTDTLQPFGLEGLRRAAELSRHRIVAIGGMNSSTIGDVIACGIEGVAVVSAIVSADSPCDASRKLRAIVDGSRCKWSTLAWRSSQELFERMKLLPFNVGLMDGTLPADSFAKYLQQDVIYLANYGEEMLQLSQLLPERNMRALFLRLSMDAVEGEKALHCLLAEQFAIECKKDAPATDVTKNYINHTRRYVDAGDVLMSLAALLPCFWVYRELGKYMLANCKKENNPYFTWIERYSSDFMDECVGYIIDMCDRFAKMASARRRAEMTRVFAESVKHEFAFFENICK